MKGPILTPLDPGLHLPKVLADVGNRGLERIVDLRGIDRVVLVDDAMTEAGARGDLPCERGIEHAERASATND